MNISEVKVGQYVALHPATDLWMRGVRFGTVERLGRKWAYIRAFANDSRGRRAHRGELHKVSPRNLEVASEA